MSERFANIQFLSDEPAKEDYFQTHTQLANAIADAIRANPHLRVIGLLGRWGSGKSTVITKLEAKLQTGTDADGIVFFTYDAWLNQSDPQRRAFLETLVKHLVKRSYIKEKEWIKELKKLAGRIEDTETIEDPVFSGEAKVFAISLIPSIIFLQLFDLDLVKGVFEDPLSMSALWSFRFLIIALLFPVLCWISINIARLLRGETLTILPPLFSGDSRKRTYIHVEKSPDPTSLEFARAFRRLARELNAAGKRLVIVIDNIDRVSEADATTLWANIRNMFLSTHDVEHVQNSMNPTIILPFDDNAVGDLFSNSEVEAVRAQITESYLDKTFDATFYVSEPVMSDWKGFLEKQLRTAFNDALAPEQIFWCVRFVEQRHKADSFQITPRYINKTVNRIAATIMPWKEQISFYAIAHYVIDRDCAKDISRFVFGDAPLLATPEPDWQRQIAAIHFGVEPLKAGQILIEAPLREAIRRNDANAFAQLARVPGFNDIFVGLTRDLVTDDAATSFEVVSHSADLLDRMGENDDHWRKESWRNLSDALVKVLPAAPVDANLPTRISPFGSRLNALHQSQLVSVVAALLGRAIEDDNSGTEKLAVLDDLLEQFIKGAGTPEADNCEIEVKCPARTFLVNWLSIKKNLFRLRIELDSEAISGAIAELSDNEEISGIVPLLVERLQLPKSIAVLQDVTADWSDISAQLVDKIRQSEPLPILASAFLTLLQLAPKEESARATLAQLTDEGHILARYNEAVGRRDHDLLPGFAGVLLAKNIAFQCPESDLSWRGYLRAHPEFAKEALKSLISASDDITIYTLASVYDGHATMRALVEEIARIQIERQNLGRLNVKKVSNNYFFYSRIAPYGMSMDFSRVLSLYEDFWQNLEDTGWGADLNRLASSLLEQPDVDSDKAARILTHRAQNATADDWSAAIVEGMGPYKISTKLLKGWDPQFGKGSPLHIALEKNRQSVIETSEKSIRLRWFELMGLVGTRPSASLLTGLIDALDRGTYPRVYELAALGGKALARAAKNHSNADLVACALIIPLTRHATGRGFLRDHGKHLKGIVSSSNSKTRGKLRKRFNQMRKSRFSDQKSFAESFQRTWTL